MRCPVRQIPFSPARLAAFDGQSDGQNHLTPPPPLGPWKTRLAMGPSPNRTPGADGNDRSLACSPPPTGPGTDRRRGPRLGPPRSASTSRPRPSPPKIWAAWRTRTNRRYRVAVREAESDQASGDDVVEGPVIWAFQSGLETPPSMRRQSGLCRGEDAQIAQQDGGLRGCPAAG